MTTTLPPSTRLPEPPEAEAPAVAAERVHPATSRSRFAIPGDMIVKSTTDLPDDQRTALRWFAEFGRKKDMSVEECAALLLKAGGESYSYDSLYQAWTGRRQGGLENLTESIEKFRRRAEEATPRQSTGFIETSLSRKLFSYFRRAFERKRLGFVFGPSQIGKTTIGANYAEQHNHGETKMYRMPTGGSLSNLMNEMAASNSVSPHSRHSDRRRRIIDSFDENMLLIVDECHQCLLGGERALASLEFIREIIDRRKCGAVLIGTDVFRDGMKTSKILRQLWLRGMPAIQLPTVSTQRDLNTFAASFNLSPAPDKVLKIAAEDGNGKPIVHQDNPLALQKEINEKFGLGRWCAILQEAADLAKERGKPMTWGFVILAHTQFEAMGVFEGGVV